MFSVESLKSFKAACNITTDVEIGVPSVPPPTFQKFANKVPFSGYIVALFYK